ncbi:MAG: flavodoxin [Eubacteriales bacterium]
MQIYYYTRTNRSKQIAEELADQYTVTCNQITDDREWGGVLNFLKGGAMASSKKRLTAQFAQPVKGEKIILVFPVWAGTFPPAVRDFIERNQEEDMVAVATSLGTKLKDRECFLEVVELIGKEISSKEVDLSSYEGGKHGRI